MTQVESENIILIPGSERQTANAIAAALINSSGLTIQNPYPNLDLDKYNALISGRGYELKYDDGKLAVLSVHRVDSGKIAYDGDKRAYDLDNALALTSALGFGEKICFQHEDQDDLHRKLVVLRRAGVNLEDNPRKKLRGSWTIGSFTPVPFKFNFSDSNYDLAEFLAILSACAGIEPELVSPFEITSALSEYIFPLTLEVRNLQTSNAETNELLRRLRRLKGTQPKEKFHYRLIAAKATLSDTVTLPADRTVVAFLSIAAAVASNGKVKLGHLSGAEADMAFIKIMQKFGVEAELAREKSSPDNRGAILAISSSKPQLKGSKIDKEHLRACNHAFGAFALLAAFAPGKTILRGLPKSSSLWRKRIHAIASMLSNLGVRVGEMEDGLVIEPPQEFSDLRYTGYDDPYLQLWQFVAASIINTKSLQAEFFGFGSHFPHYQSLHEKLHPRAKSLA